MDRVNQRPNAKEVFRAILEDPIDFDSDPWPRLSSDCRDLVQKMMERDHEGASPRSRAAPPVAAANGRGSWGERGVSPGGGGGSPFPLFPVPRFPPPAVVQAEIRKAHMKPKFNSIFNYF